ncbi:unnamed protein product, partial [Mesorhabditis belari]|uniref:RING-type domain-containing protein n=1 Tax=Mesorhabditis belari TaxID=2138241 RepID=A0AAF3J8C3_9BILA
MNVFESLNCIVCKQPFARVANQDRSPRHLYCGLAMCNECFEKEWRNFAYFLIDVLSQENSLVFTPKGYLLVKPFKIPECLICQDEYSNEIEKKKSFALQCGHIICTQCFLKTRQEYYPNNYQNTCPTCRNVTCIVVNKQKDQFHDFLNELPEMTRQMEIIEAALMNAKDARSCNECHKKNIVDEMFYCRECGFEICGACAYVKHRSHEAIPLLEKQADQMLTELQQESRNVIKTYKDLVPGLHKDLLEGIDIFETKLLSKEEILKDAPNLAELREKHKSFTKIKSKFESSAEKYLPHLRRFDAEVKQLIQTLNETPDA